MSKSETYKAEEQPSRTEPRSQGGVQCERLRRKLRWQLLVAYSVPLVLVTGYFYFQYSISVRDEVHAHLQSIAANQRNTVDLFLRERVANVETAFRPGDLGAASTDADMTAVLNVLQQENPAFSDVGLFDPQGTMVAYAGPHASLRGRCYLDEPWFQRLHDGESDHYISDVFLGFREQPHFIVAVRRRIAGEYWALRASVDPLRFAELIGRSHLIGDGEAFIVNRAGVDQTSVGHHRQRPDRRAFRHTSETEVVEYEENGRSYLAAVAWLAEHEWAVVVRTPAGGAFGHVQQTWLVAMAAVVLLAVMTTVLLALHSTRKLVGRLEAAREAEDKLKRHLFNASKLVSVGEIAAGVAHEINNPLAIIHEEAGLMTDLLDPEFQQAAEPEELRERLDAIKDATIRGRDITSKLLAFSRRHNSNPEPQDINDMVATALRMKEGDFRVSDIDVVEDFSEELPPVLVSKNEMEQVILNLLNNARDAMEHSGKLTLATRHEDGQVSCVVRDTGCGMTADQLDQVFVPFFTTKAVGKGTGLGLSISHGIVESFGGRIEVESEVGAGTTFTVTLPSASRARWAGEEGAIHVSEH